MAVKGSKSKAEDQKAKAGETPASFTGQTDPADGNGKGAETSTEDGHGTGGAAPVPETPKALVAMRPILYLAKQYMAGERLPVSNQEMVSAWIEAGSAAWQEPDRMRFP